MHGSGCACANGVFRLARTLLVGCPHAYSCLAKDRVEKRGRPPSPALSSEQNAMTHVLELRFCRSSLGVADRGLHTPDTRRSHGEEV